MAVQQADRVIEKNFGYMVMERKSFMRKVSVIIPVYNGEQYLEHCIKSACNQTYQNMEIICVDDGSVDASGRILDTIAERDPRVIVIHQKNQGESAARNRGLQIATGDYIGFMDCDDWIETDMYENLVDAMERENADMAVGGWFLDNETESKPIKNEGVVQQNVFDQKKLLEYLYNRDVYREFAYMWDKLYNKNLFLDEQGKLLLFDENLLLGGDVLYLGQLALNTRKAVYIARPFYHYLQRKDSSCHTTNISKRMDCLKAYTFLINTFENKAVDEHIIGLVKRFLVYHSACIAQIAYEQRDKDGLEYCKNIMERYKKEYVELNLYKPERIQWFEKIINYNI